MIRIVFPANCKQIITKDKIKTTELIHKGDVFLEMSDDKLAFSVGERQLEISRNSPCVQIDQFFIFSHTGGSFVFELLYFIIKLFKKLYFSIPTHQ